MVALAHIVGIFHGRQKGTAAHCNGGHHIDDRSQFWLVQNRHGNLFLVKKRRIESGGLLLFWTFERSLLVR